MTSSVVPTRGDVVTELDPTASGGSRRTTGPSRRQVLVTGGVVAAAVVVTAGCGSSGSSSTPAAGGSTVDIGDIPVGGGVVLEGKQVVVTQPTAGTFKAFSAVCPHEGCLVASVADGTITCPCHMGQFSAVDGSVQGGPPPAPLGEVGFTLSGSTITID
jgi:Rieske Fe-S protein